MCTQGCIKFAQSYLAPADVAGRSVLEVGSYDVNGTIRGIVERLEPSRYVGVDIVAGPGVDLVCSAENLLERFGPESFDVVITTEMLEHVRDWRAIIHNLKAVVRPGGVIVITTRSRGFHFHGYPADYWRYERSDISEIFADMAVEVLQADAPEAPGVFLRARRPQKFVEQDISDVRLYSIVRRRRTQSATQADVVITQSLTRAKAAARRVLPTRVQRGARHALNSVISGARTVGSRSSTSSRLDVP